MMSFAKIRVNRDVNGLLSKMCCVVNNKEFSNRIVQYSGKIAGDGRSLCGTTMVLGKYSYSEARIMMDPI